MIPKTMPHKNKDECFEAIMEDNKKLKEKNRSLEL